MATSSVLVADADPLQQQLFDMILGVDAFDLVVVGSGADALAHLRQHTPDAVVLATDLPDVSGNVICQKLKTVKRLAHVPVVLVAPEPEQGSSLPDATRKEARQAGADLLLQKPLGDKNLRERVQRLLNSPRNDTGLSPAAVNTTAILEGAPLHGFDPNDGSPLPQPGAATELGGLRAEVARLRHENDAMKTRLAKVKERVKTLQAELDEARKPRGLFGRRG